MRTRTSVLAGLVALALVAVAGCVDGSPMDPTVCTIQADSLLIEIEWRTLANCPAPPHFEVRR